MNADTLLENFEILAEAPGGINRLRELILQLATNGKLLNSSARKTNPATGLPETWMLLPFNEVAQFAMGKTPPTKNPDFWGGVNSTMWVSIGDMQDGQTITESNKTVSLKAGSEVFRREPWPEGTLLMSFKLTIGKMARLGHPAFFNEAIFAFDAGDEITNEYLFRVLPLISRSANSKGAIKGNTLNSESISQMRVPVPPLNEQEGIVAKVDELMALCDQLEETKNLRDEIRTATRKSAIDAVASATTPEELETAWKRINNNWYVIADAPESVESLRELILDLAVRGDLGNTGVSSAEESILWDVDQLKLDADKLWKLDTMRLNPADGWSRLPLARLGSWGSGGTPTASRKEFYSNGSIPWAVIGDLNNGIMTETSSKITQKALASSSAKLIPRKAVLIAMYGASIGKTAVTGIECTTNQAIAHCIVDESIVSTEYFFLVAKSLKKHLVKIGKGAAQPNISQTVLKHLLIDVPQLEAQEIVVTKVEELMALCDQLESELESRNEVVEKFARSVVSSAQA